MQKFANVLKGLGVRKGDRVAIYMGMTPELPDRHAGLRPHRRAALRHLRRILLQRPRRPHSRSHAVAVITQDGSYRRGAEVKLFPVVEEALEVLSLA